MDFLDVSALPTVALYGVGELQTNLAGIPLQMRLGLEELAKAGLIKSKDSFGFAMAKPYYISGFDFNPKWNWDDPLEFLWFVAGWGPERDKYIANAVRKLRPLLRVQSDTLEMRLGLEEVDGDFQDVVDSTDEQGRFPWGDFPWAGAVFVPVGNLWLPSASSALAEVEDHAASLLIGGAVGGEMLKIDNPAEFGPNS